MRRSRIALLMFGLAAACASGSDTDQGSPGETTGGNGGGASDTCGFCTKPPQSSCAGACSSTVYDPNGTCSDNVCTYPSQVEDCEFGCDSITGACRTAATAGDACAGVMCGDANACGGVCDAASGCCSTETYTKSTGFAYNGASICCDGTDARLGYQDCGDGGDHWANPSDPNCALAYEGSDNYGGPCAQVTCERIVCTSGEGGQGGSGRPPE